MLKVMEVSNETQAEVSRVAVRIPLFYTEEPGVRFVSAEA
jgi:hypothetical protein